MQNTQSHSNPFIHSTCFKDDKWSLMSDGINIYNFFLTNHKITAAECTTQFCLKSKFEFGDLDHEVKVIPLKKTKQKIVMLNQFFSLTIS